jgi:uncharacterized membrane protein
MINNGWNLNFHPKENQGKHLTKCLRTTAFGPRHQGCLYPNAFKHMKFVFKRILWALIVLLAILIGLVPLNYIEPDVNSGFLALKDRALLRSIGWQISFNAHIFSGAIAIMIGWVQFNRKLLAKRPKWHRALGKVYVVSALICGLTGIYIGFNATGGPIAAAGFISVGAIYFYTTLQAFIDIKNKQIARHQTMMMYSYAACLAAVTLRLYVPLLTYYLGDYLQAYRIVAWLSWVPNLLVAKILSDRALDRVPKSLYQT